MSRFKEGHIFRLCLEHMFSSKYFLKPAFVSNGFYSRPLNPKTNSFLYSSLDLYRSLSSGSNLSITTLFETSFFCLDIDRKSHSQSVYYHNLQPIINALHLIGLEGYLICYNPSGGIKIWIPLPFSIYPNFSNSLLSDYFLSQGLLVDPFNLDLLSKRSTVTGFKQVEFKHGGLKRFINPNVEIMGDMIRLPFLSKELISTSLWFDPTFVSIDLFYGSLWFDAQYRNSDFVLDNLYNVSNVLSYCPSSAPAFLPPSAPQDKTSAQRDVLAVHRVPDIDTVSPSAILRPKTTRGKRHQGAPKGNKNAKGTREDKHLTSSTFFSQTRDRATFIDRCLERVNQGWTGYSQSSDILACLAIVLSHTYRSFSDLQIAKEMIYLIPKLKGYEEYASEDTKKDLAKSINKGNWARRWAKSVVKYRNKLLAQETLKRTHDYTLKLDLVTNKWWIQSLTIEGKPTCRYSLNSGVGKGNGRIKSSKKLLINTPDEELTIEQIESKRIAIELGIEI